MKLRIEIDSNLEETEIVIKAAALTDEIADLQRLLQESKSPRLIFTRGQANIIWTYQKFSSLRRKGARFMLIPRKMPTRFGLNSMSWSLSCPVISVGYPSRLLQISVRFTRWTSPFQERAPFPLSDPQGGSCLTALPIPPKRNLRNMR